MNKSPGPAHIANADSTHFTIGVVTHLVLTLILILAFCCTVAICFTVTITTELSASSTMVTLIRLAVRLSFWFLFWNRKTVSIYLGGIKHQIMTTYTILSSEFLLLLDLVATMRAIAHMAQFCAVYGSYVLEPR
jgi:hypothetical protein